MKIARHHLRDFIGFTILALLGFVGTLLLLASLKIQIGSIGFFLMFAPFALLGALFFVGLIGMIWTSVEWLIMRYKSRRPNKSPEPTAVTPVSPHSRSAVSGRRWLSFFR